MNAVSSHPAGAMTRRRALLVTLTFEDAGRGRTKFTLRQERFNSVEDRDGHNGGWNSAFDRLGDLLKTIDT